MKILLLDLGKIMRGGQRQVFYLARALARTPGFDPIVAVPVKSPLIPLLDAEGIAHLLLPSFSDLNPLNILRLFRIISAHRPDIVHTNDAKGASLAAMARKALGGFKLVHSRRVSYRLKRGWSWRKYEAGDALVAVSREIQQVLVDCGIPAEKTSTIHSGIDAEMYSTGKNDHPVLTIGAVGALSTQKGFEVLIEALAELKKHAAMPDWQCLIAGDGPLFQELKVKADTLGLADVILFLGYRDSREVLPEIDVLTVPSVDGEGSNAVIKEGWASATPVITSDLPSNLELVTHEHNGLVFRNRDARELAEAIVRIVRDPELAQTLVQNGTASVSLFTDKSMADKYMLLYRSLATPSS
ncbi:MAG: glycosyltransferase family 4 protein [Pseudodesulfovibrio sp.]|uniref:Glycosyl transferase group 1 n=1 Tax=Pseudodesulfovibrio aespoeensis (strain ATCC 700646 / DSM 10631 / Aspo-2) TaxID=643562 RepID=E6VXZ2_PSEA9|nr:MULTISPECIES: glycosyltransferase family 4 protein [Pseudodesulfovibrio]MBU4377520.1 glycosyltransferase family 4 protein [Pseudomonadota bacterium]ADU62699.1 glycosyl transferase group 1 [Pseudodesulfovibrio aespoeensis Aspo-2]MBU4515636.1 glycosyltransferase family 4 protein [Pseudomonadota bacterium]MBU4523421.1 glycosyltransferase family 4 protein [Pseudomonadota bacterium]MBU4560473.1 glycosyltransferase family 4 protein [Pseudomonadota bacterium]